MNEVLQPGKPQDTVKAYVGPKGPAPKLFEPIDNQICVQIVFDASGSTTEGGIILPDNVGWRNPVYSIIAVGPMCKQVKEGDQIICQPQGRMQVVRYAGNEYLLTREQEVQGIILQNKG